MVSVSLPFSTIHINIPSDPEMDHEELWCRLTKRLSTHDSSTIPFIKEFGGSIVCTLLSLKYTSEEKIIQNPAGSIFDSYETKFIRVEPSRFSSYQIILDNDGNILRVDQFDQNKNLWFPIAHKGLISPKNEWVSVHQTSGFECNN